MENEDDSVEADIFPSMSMTNQKKVCLPTINPYDMDSS
jgi:hypothetical protein